MFSYSARGVESNILTGRLSLEELVNFIKDHPKKDIIKQLHALEYGSDSYTWIKKTLPYVMPHGIFAKGRKMVDLRDLSGALYYDIDAVDISGDIEELKHTILQKHRDKICMLGRSVGNRGLFLYIRLENPEVLTEGNFDALHEYVRTTILSDISTDPGAKGIARTHIIPYDPNLYYNPIASLEVDLDAVPAVKKSLTTSIKENLTTGYCGDETFLPISEVRKRVKTRTSVDLKGKEILVENILCCDLFIPKLIRDGQKHKIFTSMVNGLMLNNPSLELIYVLSFINYVNTHYTGERPMPRREMIRTVTAEYRRIQSGGQIKAKYKRYHTDVDLGKQKRLKLVAQTRGKEDREKSIAAIRSAVYQLKKAGEKPTQIKVAKLLNGKPSLATIKRYWRRVVPTGLPSTYKLGIRGVVKPRQEPIPGFEDYYEITENGTIYSYNQYNDYLDQLGTISKRIDRGGYYAVRLSKNGKIFTRHLHKLLAATFIPNPLSLNEIDHVDGNKLNFTLTNLRYCTHSQNTQYAYDLGLNSAAKKIIDNLNGRIYVSIREAADAIGINYNTCCKRLKRNDPNFPLRYLR